MATALVLGGLARVVWIACMATALVLGGLARVARLLAWTARGGREHVFWVLVQAMRVVRGEPRWKVSDLKIGIQPPTEEARARARKDPTVTSRNNPACPNKEEQFMILDPGRFHPLSGAVDARGEDLEGSMFRKRPVVVQAFRWTGDIGALTTWAARADVAKRLERDGVAATNALLPISLLNGQLEIETLDGTHRANLGDWIICGVKGEFYPCKPEIFEMTYEPAAATPELA